MYNVLHFETLPSTNTYALENLNTLDDCTIISADIQTEGKGRLGRKWLSEIPNNLYLSIVLKNISIPEVLSTLPLFTALSVCKTLQNFKVAAQIKWPNDIFVDNKKIGGILCETKSTAKGCIIIGIGVNLNLNSNDLHKIDQPSTALNLQLNKIIELSLFRDAFLESFFQALPDFKENAFISIKLEFFNLLQKKDIIIKNSSNIIHGDIIDISDCGAILVKDKQGKIQEFSSGEIIS